LTAFKGVYYLKSFLNPYETYRAWKNRKQAIRDTGSEPNIA
jgi:hypothetical protein